MSESGYECPECGARLQYGKCRACGWKPTPAGNREEAKHGSDKARCAWDGAQARCRMLGEHSDSATGSGRWLCGWHAAVRSYPHGSDDFSEFERWLSTRAGHYCSAWFHYPSGVLWDLVQGIPVQADPQPCGLTSCGYALSQLVGMPGRPGFMARQAVEAATHRLEAPVDLEARRLAKLVRFREYQRSSHTTQEAP